MAPRRSLAIGPVGAGILTGVAALLSSWTLRNFSLPTELRLLVALLPGPFFVWFILVELRALQRADEFQRRVLLESLAIAFPAAITIAVVIDGLQKGGFVTAWSIGDLWPFLALTWLPALWIADRRYPRDGGEE
jgi:hypothetical protein